MMNIEQILDYMNYAAIADKYKLDKEVIQSIEPSKVAELNSLLADNSHDKLVLALRYSKVQEIVFSDFKYIERLQTLLSTYDDIECDKLNTLLNILSDSKQSIDDFSDDTLHTGVQTYTDTNDILVSFVYMYYQQTHQDSCDNSDSTINNIEQCVKLPSSYYCHYMSHAQEIRTILQLPEYQELLQTVKSISDFSNDFSFDSITDLNIITAPKFLNALNSNHYLHDFLYLGALPKWHINDILMLSEVLDDDVYFMLIKTKDLLFPDEYLFPDFLKYWKDSQFALDILKTFYTKASKTVLLDFKRILKNQMTFLSFLYKEMYYEIIVTLDNLSKGCTDLIVYALSHNKHRFLSLLLSNKNVSIESMGKNSVLFAKEFYQKHFNIDSLDEKALAKILQVHKNSVNMKLLEEDRIYTLNEILLLKSTDERYYQFYYMLKDLHIDKRILLTKQLKKQHLLSDKNWDEQFNDRLSALAKHLSNKSLYDWLYQDFAHIKEIDALSVCKLLMLYDTHSNVIPSLQSMGEVKFLLRNFNDIDDTFKLSELKQNFISYDSRLNELFSDLSISDEFIKAHYDNIYHFWLHDGISMYFTYKQNNNKKLLRSNLKLIVKAELAGKLKELKYHENDLEKEIVYYDISKESKETWVADRETIYENITVKECDDFISIFQAGATPVSTCLNYKGGSYSECLLSNFDSNKKLVNIFMDNVLVGRALLRLTKAMFDKDAKSVLDVSFTDVSSNVSSNEKEHLILFLEKAYFSGINEKKQVLCVKHLLNFLKQKANAMHITKIMFSTMYDKYMNLCDITDYSSVDCAVYISRSKSGVQYLDSFSGYNDISKEGQYIKTKCNLFY